MGPYLVYIYIYIERERERERDSHIGDWLNRHEIIRVYKNYII